MAILVCCGIQFASGIASARHLIDAGDAVRKIYGKTVTFERMDLTLTPEQITRIEQSADVNYRHGHTPNVIVYIVRQDGQISGYAFEDLVVGKWGPIHYLLGLTPQGQIKEAMVLDYDEIRGKPVAKRRFLRQYDGKNIEDPLRLRDDIDGISGATISSMSMTDGIRKILHIFDMNRGMLVP